MSSTQKKLKHNEIWAIILQHMLRNAETPKEETETLLKKLCKEYNVNTYRICIRYITYILENGLDSIPSYADVLAELRTLENTLQVRGSEDDGGQKLKMARITLKPWQEGYSWVPYMDAIFLDDEVGYERAVWLIADMVGISPREVHEQYRAHISSVLEHEGRYFEYRESLSKRKGLISWKEKNKKLDTQDEGEKETRHTRSRRRRTKTISAPVRKQHSVSAEDTSDPSTDQVLETEPALARQVEGYVLNLQYLVKLLESKHTSLDSSRQILKDHITMLHDVMNIIQCEEKSDVSEIS